MTSSSSDPEVLKSKDTFTKYINEIATIIPDDEYFIQYIEKEFENVKEEKEITLGKNSALHQLNLIRQRLISKANLSQEEYFLRNIFRKFETNGVLTIEELAGLVSSLGI